MREVTAMTAPQTDRSPADERFVFVPLTIRREHWDWPPDEHAAWLDLYLASYEVDGIFDSLDVARAYLGPRAVGLDGLIARGSFIEVDGTWRLVDYWLRYNGRRPRHYRSLDEHLAAAATKAARGEPLSGIERWARWKARSQGADLPDLRKHRGRTDGEGDVKEDVDGENEKEVEVDTANVGPTLGRLQTLSGPDHVALQMRKARAHIDLFKEGPAVPRTVWCQDFSRHQLQHRQQPDGTWFCSACVLDPDHAEPQAEGMAADWAFESPAGGA
jgi:hypothetical protein